ncbi:conserved hypothetical protein [Burkholderia diffusa]|uniref:hypothetical protein n=1 Tax=Burkholderia diffusa TaxID=488732 RepID=UPI001CAFDD57|nr:hypothetical protein [Burkholderia diffusa]CAG9251342.1 conserved hypothetical protein [Burkholderia diffusa]
MKNFELEFPKTITNVSAVYTGNLADLFEAHFAMNVDAKRHSLHTLAARAMSNAMGVPIEIDRDNPEDALAFEEAEKWSSVSYGTATKRLLLNFIAHGLLIASWIPSRLTEKQWAGAADLLSQVGHFHGLAMATELEMRRKSRNGKKGAEGRKETIDEMINRSMTMYRAMNLDGLPASRAAEKVRHEGAPLSYEKLVRLIRAERKGDLDSKLREEET